ncbi:hypothetical protein POJ06DRAFT_252000 [Lipomyces tetrasporus]|uniref:Uncharacterized protein n=1 Tax=Lipomyces tetrasporus TaxID=54092 RepID=A0AAD7QRW1_9ASCO|nr:uncharacterized protein POJ06DRAFT_252000 [Lipomyces tetrasporus]KAJ8100188.1 hypothetical protein POJ06DRAFT_252000 [Lipomyces tetrasporus]
MVVFKLYSRLPGTWAVATVDFALLSFTIVLFSANTQYAQRNYNLEADHRSMYLSNKA